MVKARMMQIQNLCTRGKAHLKYKRFNEALLDFQTALRLNPNNYVIHTEIGETLRRMSRIQEAIESLKLAKQLFELDLLQGINGATEKSWEYQATSYYLALCWNDLRNTPKSIEILWAMAKKLFAGWERGKREEVEILEEIFLKAETCDIIGHYEGAFKILQPLVYNKLVAISRRKCGVASR